MSHVIHIFRKDLRRYWPYALALLLLTAVQAALYGRPREDWLGFATAADRARTILEAVLVVARGLLAVLVVQQDSVPGSAQDWLTRPIGWRKMLAAKALFILAVIVVPNMLADLCSIAMRGFNPLEHVPGLVASHTLRLAFVTLPLVAVAVLTSGLTQVLAVVVVLFVPLAILGALDVGYSAYLGGLEWTRTSSLFAATAVISLLIALRQYATRSTTKNAPIAAIGCFLLFCIPYRFPESAARIVERAGTSSVARTVKVDLDRSRAGGPAVAVPSRKFGQPSRGFTVLYVPIRISGVPAGLRPELHWLSAELVSAAGARWHTLPVRLDDLHRDSAGDWLTLRIANEYLDKHSGGRVRLTARLSLALVSSSAPVAVRFGAPPAFIPGLGRCGLSLGVRYATGTLFAWCQQPFMQPRAVEAAIQLPGVAGAISVPQTEISNLLNPLPADFGFDPIGVTRLHFAPVDTMFDFTAGMLPRGANLNQAVAVFARLTPASLAECTLIVPDFDPGSAYSQ